MNLTRIMLAGTLLTAAPAMTLSTASAQQSGPLPSAATEPASTQQPQGMVTTIDRINNTIVIRQTQSGTVGANNGGAADQQFSSTADLLENVHAGDKVTYAVKDSGGKKMITKIDRQP